MNEKLDTFEQHLLKLGLFALHRRAEKLGYRVREATEYHLVLEPTGGLQHIYDRGLKRFDSEDYESDASAYLDQVEHETAIYRRNEVLRALQAVDENGKLTAYAWPGGYPIVYLTREGDELCADCAQDDETVTGFYVLEEGPAVYCEEPHCGKEIGSASGDPSALEEQEGEEGRMFFAGTIESEETYKGLLPDGRFIYVQIAPYYNAPSARRDDPLYWYERFENKEFDDGKNYPSVYVK